ncbi:MAG: crosslink repair DNA glycosylase YcaQ family protein, partial [Acidobacteriota bacterium]
MITLARDEARSYLLGQLGLRQAVHGDAISLLAALRCIQLDPLDAIGTNVDLVAMARVDTLSRGDVFRQVYPGHAFEHWAKERCLLPVSAYPYYRARGAAESRWWRHAERMSKLPPGLVEEVLAEIRERGPL